jgi:hypothetical protein
MVAMRLQKHCFVMALNSISFSSLEIAKNQKTLPEKDQ